LGIFCEKAEDTKKRRKKAKMCFISKNIISMNLRNKLKSFDLFEIYHALWALHNFDITAIQKRLLKTLN
jgi:hypothetical protein